MVVPLDAIPGVNQRVIEGVVAEIGVDMRRFPSDRHLTSWTGICPGQHESAGTHQRQDTEREPLAVRFATTAEFWTKLQKTYELRLEQRSAPLASA